MIATPTPWRATVGGRQRRTPQRLGAGLFLLVVLAFLGLPLLTVVVFSFNTLPRVSLPLAGLTIHWYEVAFGDPAVRQALIRTAIAAVATALIAGPFGVAAALGLQLISARARLTLLTAIQLPIAMPGLLLAVALAIYYRQVLGIGFSLWAAIAGHIMIALPFVVLVMNAAVANFRFSMLEAARDLGASPLQAFSTVTFPLIRPAIEGAMLLSIAISVDEFIITLFTVGRDTTLPMLIWSRVQRNVDPSINALATVLLVATTIFALLAARRTTVLL